MALHAAKMSLRHRLKDKLRNIPTENKILQSKNVVSKLLQHEKYLKSQRISVYLSRDIEIDTREILVNIFESRKECFIPKYDSKSTNMDMVKLKSLEDFENLPSTSWNIKQHSDTENNLENALDSGGLDLIIVPGIGFTKEGHRIGNGRGYYDVYLSKYEKLYGKNFTTIALAFKEQIVPSIPVSEHDIKIDEVIYFN